MIFDDISGPLSDRTTSGSTLVRRMHVTKAREKWPAWRLRKDSIFGIRRTEQKYDKTYASPPSPFVYGPWTSM